MQKADAETTFRKHEFAAMHQFSQTFGECHKGWNGRGHWRAVKIKEVDIVYALSEKKITFPGEGKPLIGDFKIPQMAHGYTIRGFSQSTIESRETD